LSARSLWIALIVGACGRLEYSTVDGDGGAIDGGAGLDARAALDAMLLPDGAAPGDAPSGDGAGPTSDSAPGRPITWGRYITTLALPACPPPATTLTVDTAADDRDGGSTLASRAGAGATLSFAEALTIAANVGGAGAITIDFSPTVFPIDAPSTIVIATDPGSIWNLVDTCIDARGAGVIVEWDPAATVASMWALGVGSRLIGMTLLGTPYQLNLGEGAQVAGCRLRTDGSTVFSGTGSASTISVVDPSGGSETIVGPHNVIAGTFGVTFGGAEGQVLDNWIGWDPLTRTRLDPAGALLAGLTYFPYRRVLVAGNVIVSTVTVQAGADMRLVLTGNRFGIDRLGEPIAGAGGFAYHSAGGEVTFGPGNIVTGTDLAIGVQWSVSEPIVTITQNSVYANGAGISYLPIGSAPAAPTVIDASDSGASGGCTGIGSVEVFHDAAREGEVYVATTACSAGSWSLAAALPSGRNVTATMTVAGRTSAFSAPRAVP
jgi:hypothetical protein